MAIVSFVLSIIAFFFTLIQFLTNSPRQKKEATLHAYSELQKTVFTPLNCVLTNDPGLIDRIKKEDDSKPHSEEWEEITSYLAQLERFSVGVNTGIFSKNITNRLGGAYLIRIYDTLEPIVSKKRENDKSKGDHYEEFNELIFKLRSLRAKKGGAFRTETIGIRKCKEGYRK